MFSNKINASDYH